MSDTPKPETGKPETGKPGSFDSAHSDPEALDRVVAAAAMRLAAEKDWNRVALLDVARAAGVPLSTFHQRYQGRADLLAAVSRVVDAAVLAADPSVDSEENARDRLFDVMMRRFDALLPFRDGLRAVLRDLPGEPVTALCYSRAFGRSMGWMLRIAGIDPDQRGGQALVAGLGAVHVRVIRVFLNDDSADLSRTMASLDTELRRAQRWSATFCRWQRRPPRPAEPFVAPSA